MIAGIGFSLGLVKGSGAADLPGSLEIFYRGSRSEGSLPQKPAVPGEGFRATRRR